MKPQYRSFASFTIITLLVASAISVLPNVSAGIAVPALFSRMLAAVADQGPQKDAPLTSEIQSVANDDDDKFVRSQRPIPGRYIVVLDEEAVGPRGENSRAAAVANELSAIHGGRVERIYTHAINGFSVEMNEGRAIALSKDRRVRYVEEDSIGTATAVQPNATWGLDRIDQRGQPLDTFYNYNLTGAGVTAYVLDSGIRTTHTDFGGRASSGVDLMGGNGQDCNGHGTHVAGTLGGTTWGVAKSVSLVSVRVLDCFGNGSASSFISGVDWVTANGIKPAVVNMSLGTVETESLNAAVTNSINSGLTYVVAAGNETQNACNLSPASASTAITVSASDIADQKAGFANYGVCVDLFAPGVNITSAWYTDDNAINTIFGTSMAAPHAAGAAALYLQANPGATPSQVRAFLYSESTKGIIGSSNSPTNHLLYTNWAATPILPPNTPPTASFTHNCDGNTCTFDGAASSDSDGAVAAYAWDFGDGQIGYGANIVHTYSSFSTFFAVTLRVIDDDGDVSPPQVLNGNTLLGTNITINEQFGNAKITFPQVTKTGNTRLDPFSGTVAPYGNTICSVCAAYSVTTSAVFTTPITVSLDVPASIDDATFNSMSLLVYPYPNFDVPPINITTGRTTNPDGTREIIGQANQLGTYALATQVAGPPPQTPPTLSNTAVTSVNENGVATLTGNISDPNVGDTFTLTVNWGDGSVPETFNYLAGTTSFSETHRYLDNPAGQPNGNYTINMSLADNAGGTAAPWALFVGVANVAPTLSNITATPATITVGESTTITGSITEPGTLDSVTVTIDWRDPVSGATVIDLPAGTTNFTAQHQYNQAGNYALNISVRDKDFAATPYNPAVTVTVNDAPAPQLINVSVTSPISENGTATLSGNISSQVAGTSFDLQVNWGDGGQQTFSYLAGTTSFNETHQYLDNPAGQPGGSYPISLTLIDGNGASDTDSSSVTVNNVSPMISNLQLNPNPITAGGATTLTAASTDPGTLDTQIVSINWGDGSPNTTLPLGAGASAISAPHQYTQAGDFNIDVTATDKDGGQVTSNISITVVAAPPPPSPTPTPPRVPDAPFTEIGLNGSAFAGLTPGPDNGRLYGVTYDGPASDNEGTDIKLDAGTLYSVDRDLTNRIDHYTFITASDGNTPYNELTWVPSEGKFFGATSAGAVEGGGKIFTFDPATNVFATMPGGFTGEVWGSLALANGYLYGTVQSYPEECIFRLRPSDFAVSFIQCVPWGSSLQGVSFGADGWLYGNSLYAGQHCDPNAPGRGCGEIFKIRPWNDNEQFNPQYQVIFQFQFYGGNGYPCPPGDKFCVRFPVVHNYPVQKLVYGSDGKLYGSTFYSVFRLDPHAANVTDSFRTLWNDGGGIQATVIEGLDGRLYFTDYGGGSDGVGRIASMNKDGSGVFELRNFNRTTGSTATGPWGRLFNDPVTGRLYGTTEYTNEGFPWPGTAFFIEVPPVEYHLSGSADGTAPVAVDDALDIFVNDTLFYTDGIAPSGLRGPIPVPDGYFDPGDIVRFEVRDVYGDCQSLSPIYLVDNFGNSTLMTPGLEITCGHPAGDNGVIFTDTKTVPGTVNTAPVISSFTAPSTLSEHGVANLSFLVSDSNSADALRITVNWGDGSTNEEYTTPAGSNIPINLSHRYLDDQSGTTPDAYLLTVSVTDGLAIDTESQSIAVSNLEPSINSLSATPSTLSVGGSTTLSGTFGDVGTLDTFTVRINWGDGSPLTQLPFGAGSTEFSSAHQYTAAGNYAIDVTVVDDDGGQVTSSTPITVDPAPIPAVPSGLSAVAPSVGRVDLSWVDNSSDESEFRVERCSGGKKCNNYSQIATQPANSTAFSDLAVNKNMNYFYRVRACNAGGCSAYSNIATVKTPRK